MKRIVLFLALSVFSFKLFSLSDRYQFITANPYCTSNSYGFRTEQSRSLLPPSYSNDLSRIEEFSAKQFETLFYIKEWSEERILAQHNLYLSDEFIKYIQTFPGYEDAVIALHHRYQSMSWATKCLLGCAGIYRPSHEKRIEELYQNTKRCKWYVQPVYAHRKIVQIFKTSTDKQTAVKKLYQLADQVFANTIECKLEPDIKEAVYASLDTMQETVKVEEVIFHSAVIGHLLSHVEKQACEPWLIECSPKLIVQALTTFIKALNPIKQVKDTVQSWVDLAHFVSDVTIGKLYLCPKQYKQRIDGFLQTLEALSPKSLAKLEAEQWIDIAAQIAADFAYGKGFYKIANYAKELQAVNKMRQSATMYAHKLKNVLDVKLVKSPLFVTADGLIMKAVHEGEEVGKSIGRIIKTAEEVLEACHSKMMQELQHELILIKKSFDCTRLGFESGTRKYVKIAYEHILGMGLHFDKNGLASIGGFHIDCKNFIEKSGALQFMEKEIFSHDFYKAKLYFEGKPLMYKSFFPAHWSRHQVIAKVYEAYDNFIAAGKIPEIMPDGKYLIKAITNEGIELRMHMTKNYLITTAYPVL